MKGSFFSPSSFLSFRSFLSFLLAALFFLSPFATGALAQSPSAPEAPLQDQQNPYLILEDPFGLTEEDFRKAWAAKQQEDSALPDLEPAKEGQFLWSVDNHPYTYSSFSYDYVQADFEEDSLIALSFIQKDPFPSEKNAKTMEDYTASIALHIKELCHRYGAPTQSFLFAENLDSSFYHFPISQEGELDRDAFIRIFSASSFDTNLSLYVQWGHLNLRIFTLSDLENIFVLFSYTSEPPTMFPQGVFLPLTDLPILSQEQNPSSKEKEAPPQDQQRPYLLLEDPFGLTEEDFRKAWAAKQQEDSALPDLESAKEGQFLWSVDNHPYPYLSFSYDYVQADFEEDSLIALSLHHTSNPVATKDLQAMEEFFSTLAPHIKALYHFYGTPTQSYLLDRGSVSLYQPPLLQEGELDIDAFTRIFSTPHLRKSLSFYIHWDQVYLFTRSSADHKDMTLSLVYERDPLNTFPDHFFRPLTDIPAHPQKQGNQPEETNLPLQGEQSPYLFLENPFGLTQEDFLNAWAVKQQEDPTLANMTPAIGGEVLSPMQDPNYTYASFPYTYIWADFEKDSLISLALAHDSSVPPQTPQAMEEYAYALAPHIKALYHLYGTPSQSYLLSDANLFFYRCPISPEGELDIPTFTRIFSLPPLREDLAMLIQWDQLELRVLSHGNQEIMLTSLFYLQHPRDIFSESYLLPLTDLPGFSD
ncbi:MAG: hypothetical protein GX786_01480 [Clostridiales bacterium]|nr:hypothetical protein [Clostridiales bacterium]